MKTINFDYTGGFPLDQTVLKRMQTAYLESMQAFVKHIGCGDIGKYIIHGCDVLSDTITPGMMYIDGDLCPFPGSLGSLSTKIKKVTTTTTAAFENGSNPPVYVETTAVVDPSGTMLSDYIRFNYVNDANYVHTDNNFTAALLAKLNGIAPGAEVNVQTNWDETNPLSDAYLVGRPAGNLLTYLWKGTYSHGDLLSGIQLITISFPSVGTSNYTVLAQVTGLGVWQRDAKVNCVVRGDTKTPTSFQISLCDYTNESVQDLRVDLVIIPN